MRTLKGEAGPSQRKLICHRWLEESARRLQSKLPVRGETLPVSPNPFRQAFAVANAKRLRALPSSIKKRDLPYRPCDHRLKLADILVAGGLQISRSTVIDRQIAQLETAILQGKDHTDEVMLPDAVQFQNDYWKDRPSPVIHRGNPYRAASSAPYSGGMAINTAWNPGGNAPSMVPMVPGSRSPWGYQAGL